MLNKMKAFAFLFVLMFALVLAACNSESSTTSNDESQPAENEESQGESNETSDSGDSDDSGKDVQISFGGSSPGGVYYYMVGVMANLLSEKIEGVNVTNVSTGASVANVLGVADGKLDFGMTYGSLIYEAWNGVDTFEDQGPMKNIRGIVKAYESPHYFVVMADSGIETLSDLKGKKVSLGPPGSGANYNSNIILNTLGLEVEREYLAFADAGRALKEGRIDAFGQSGAPSGAVTELSETSEIRIIPFSDEEMKTLVDETGFYNVGELPTDTYKGIDEPIQMPYFPVYWFANENVDPEVVEKIVEIALDESNRQRLVDGHPLWEEMTVDTENFEKLGPEIHPGAKSYFEKNGLN